MCWSCFADVQPHCWVHKRSFPGAEFNWCVREQRRGDNYTSIILMEISHWEREREMLKGKAKNCTTKQLMMKLGKHRERKWCPTAIKSRHKPRGEKMNGAFGFVFICTHKNKISAGKPPETDDLFRFRVTIDPVYCPCSCSRCE